MENIFLSWGQNLNFNSPFVFIIVFIGGVLVSFTPCLYPLIPLTIGFIGAKSSGSKLKGFFLSLVYVFGIAVTYSLLGAIASMSGKVFGSLTSTPIVYFITANIFLILGLSMLGVFNLPLPKLLLRPGVKSGGAISAFLLGLVSGLVVGPCTAPALGGLLVYVSTKQNVLYGMSLLFVFAYGMGTLLILLGTFTALLTAIPKSGAWLERIKKACVAVLVLAAEYFFVKAGGLLKKYYI